MKKFIFLGLLIILGISFAQGMDTRPTRIEDRCKVFESYYLNQPENNDPGIFDHMKSWHEADFVALYHTVQLPANQEKLQGIREGLNQSFETQTVTHSKIAVAYLLYSMVTSSISEMELQGDTDGAIESERVDRTIHYGREYIAKKGTSDYTTDPMELYGINYALGKIALWDQDDLRWLPFVSLSGAARFRPLNSQFGMKAPLIGLPLGRGAYDGNLNVTPFDHIAHDILHGGFSSLCPEAVKFVYDIYRKADAIVRDIKEPKVKTLCDFSLFEVGHEAKFCIMNHPAMTMNTEGVPEFPSVVTKTAIEAACDMRLEEINIEINKVYGLGPSADYFDFHSQSIKPWPNKDALLTLSPFVNPQTGVLYSLIEIINHFGFNKDTVLSVEEITDKISPGFLNSLPDSQHSCFDHWRLVVLHLNFYNQLIGLKAFFNRNGMEFDLWKGNEFQADAISAFFKEACETFKREVGPHFKNFFDS